MSERPMTEFGMGMRFGQANVIAKLPPFSRAVDAIVSAAMEWRLHKTSCDDVALRQEIANQLWLSALDYEAMVSDFADSTPATPKEETKEE